MTIRHRTIYASVVIALAAAASSPATHAAGGLASCGTFVADRRPAVSVNGHVFTVAQVEAVALRENGDAVLDQMIDEMLLNQAGQKVAPALSRAEMEGARTRLRAQAKIVRMFQAMEPSMPEIAASVNGTPIPMKAVVAEAMRLAGANVIDRFINNELVEQEARRQRIVVTGAEIAAQLETLRKAIAPVTLADGLKRHHQTMPMLQADIVHGIQRRKLVERQYHATTGQDLTLQYVEDLRAKASIVIYPQSTGSSSHSWQALP